MLATTNTSDQEARFKEFVAICVLGVFAIFSSTMSKSPTLPLFAKYLGASPTEIGIIAAASTIIGIFTNITAGTLSDVYGRKPLILAANLVFASAPFLYLRVASPWQLILVRAYHGVATAILAPVISAVVADLFPTHRGERMSLLSSAQYVGRLLAPVLGGALISLYGFSSVFLTCGVNGSIALTMAVLLFFLPRIESHPAKRRQVLLGLKGLTRDSSIVSVSSTQAVIYLSSGPVETFLPLFAQNLGLSAFQSGFLLMIQTAMTLLTGPLIGRLSDQYGRHSFMMGGLALVAVSLVLLPLSPGFLPLVLVMLAYGTGWTMTTTVIPPLVSDLAPPQLYGVSLGALETIKDVGQTFGPIIAGLAIAQIGYFGAFSFIGGIIATNFAILRWTLTWHSNASPVSDVSNAKKKS